MTKRKADSNGLPLILTLGESFIGEMTEMTEEKNELILAFRSYSWIIFNTNPITEKLGLHNRKVPPYIKKRVDEYKEQECTRYYIENRIEPPYILSSISINRLLIQLVQKGIPLYKVGNKEISCVADIKRLWKAAGVTRTILEYKELYQIAAYLQPQDLKIEKNLMLKLEPEKQIKTKDTPEKVPQAKLLRGIKQPYADQNELNDFMKKIIEKNPASSSVQIARKAKNMMKNENHFLDDNGNPLYKEATLKNRICKLRKGLKHTISSFSKLKNDEKMTKKKRYLKSDVKT